MKKTTLKTLALVCTGLFVSACSSSSEEMPSAAATNTGSVNSAQNTANSNTSTNTNTANNSNTSTSTNTANNSNTSTSTNTANNSNTSTSTNTANNSNTSTSTNTANNSNTSTSTNTANNSNTSTNTANNTASTSGSKTGTALIGQINNAYNSPFSAVNSANFDTVTIDGKQFALTNNGNVGTLFTEIQETDTSTGVVKKTTASGKRLSYMRFGSTLWVNGGTGEEKSYDYAFGDVTPTSGSDAVPTSGTASYSGLALLSNIGGGGWIQGTSTFNVNFGRKTITGNVDAFPYKVDLSGNISGASFSGEKNGIEMQGSFYGPKAAELGGVFKGSIIDSSSIGTSITNVTGSFGAKKQ